MFAVIIHMYALILNALSWTFVAKINTVDICGGGGAKVEFCKTSTTNLLFTGIFSDVSVRLKSFMFYIHIFNLANPICYAYEWSNFHRPIVDFCSIFTQMLSKLSKNIFYQIFWIEELNKEIMNSYTFDLGNTKRHSIKYDVIF